MSVQATRSTSILRHDLIGKVCSEVTRATAVSLSPSGVDRHLLSVINVQLSNFKLV